MIFKSVHILLGLCASLLLVSLNAQSDDRPLAEDAPFYKNGLRASLITWLDPLAANARIGYDHRVSDRYLLRQEAGYYYQFEGVWGPSGGLLDLDGFSLHTSIRRMASGSLTRSNADDKPFFDLSLLYRYLKTEIAGDFIRDDFAFSRRFNYSVKENSFGLSLSGGQVFGLSKHFWVEYSVGIGLMVSYQDFSEISVDARFDTNQGLRRWRYRRDEEVPFVTLMMPLGFSLIYAW